MTKKRRVKEKSTDPSKGMPVDPGSAPPSDDRFPKMEFSPDDPGQAWLNEDGFMHLSKYDLLQIENLRHIIEMHKEAAQARKYQADQIEHVAVLKVRNMRVNAQGYDKMRGEAEEEYASLISTLGEKYGVDFKKVGYDDVSGRLTVLPEDKNKE